MQQNSKKRWNEVGWGVGASIFIHVAIAVLLFLKLPEWPPEPPKDEAVNVELVPPPEEKPPEKPPEEKKAEAPKPPEKPPEEKPPEQPKPPEPPKQEEKPAPPPPPPPPPEQPKPEEKPPEAPKQEPPKDDQQAEKPADQKGKPQSMPVLRPVFEFGDKDTGPKKSTDGDSSVASAKPAEQPPLDEPKPEPEPPKPADPPKAEEPPKPVEPPEAAEPPKPADPVVAEKPPASKDEPVTPEPPANPVPQDIEVPQVEAAQVNPEKSGPTAPSTDDAKTDFALPTPVPTPPPETKSETKDTPDAAKPDALEKVKTLFSENATGDGVAKTAMGNVPRGARVGQLCSTELREQLRHSEPAYRPELLPAYRLSTGTVLDVRRGAFRAADGWYNLSFRCEVDPGATKVVSFAFDVGDPVPRSEWQSRRLPEN